MAFLPQWRLLKFSHPVSLGRPGFLSLKQDMNDNLFGFCLLVKPNHHHLTFWLLFTGDKSSKRRLQIRQSLPWPPSENIYWSTWHKGISSEEPWWLLGDWVAGVFLVRNKGTMSEGIGKNWHFLNVPYCSTSQDGCNWVRGQKSRRKGRKQGVLATWLKW